MKTVAIAVSAAIFGILTMSSANAAPASSPAIKSVLGEKTGVVEVQYKKKRKAYRKGYRQGYRAGHKYRNPPRGWRRYSARPYGWQSRGCVVVGPVWFCP